jgi:hypothetical protein
VGSPPEALLLSTVFLDGDDESEDRSMARRIRIWAAGLGAVALAMFGLGWRGT